MMQTLVGLRKSDISMHFTMRYVNYVQFQK